MGESGNKENGESQIVEGCLPKQLSQVSIVQRLSAIDKDIETANKHFYTLLMNKRRNIRRNLLQMNATTNEYLLETLSYRLMLVTSELNSSTSGTSDSLLQECSVVEKEEESLMNSASNIFNDAVNESFWNEPDLEAENDLEIQRVLNSGTHKVDETEISFRLLTDVDS